MKVVDLLREKGGAVSTVPKSLKLSECVIVMSDQNLGSLVVIENGDVVGLLTFREVINILAKRQKELRQGPTPPVAELRRPGRKPQSRRPRYRLPERADGDAVKTGPLAETQRTRRTQIR